MEKPWWHNAVVYQIYPKSFNDTDGDGIGDLQGIVEKMDYIKSLGVNVIWINPIFRSPQVDNGYDVSDYYSIDPQFGTNADLEHLIAEAKKRDLKIIFDLVVNHTSDQHPWFQEARKSLDNSYRDFYIWRDGKNGKEPNNWASFFGGSVWAYEPLTNQYYFHLFDKKMPDLNWENPKVRAELYKMARYWLEKGIDGFRLDAIIHLAKDQSFHDFNNPDQNEEFVISEPCYANLPKVHAFIREFSRQMKRVKPDCLLIGEAASADVELAKRYTKQSREECDCVISFKHLDAITCRGDTGLPKEWQEEHFDLKSFQKIMKHWQKELYREGWPALFLNNHDMPRMLSRFGDPDRYRNESAKMLATLMYLHWGMPFIFQGEEIGMTNLELEQVDDYHDSILSASASRLLKLGYSYEQMMHRVHSRSKHTSRGAMHWDTTSFSGFSERQPWLGVNKDDHQVNVAEQDQDPQSILNYYRSLLKIRANDELFVEGLCRILDVENEFIYAYERRESGKTALVICNFSNQPQFFDQPDLSSWTCLLNNLGKIKYEETSRQLAPYECYVLVKNNKEDM
jgi:oligo-1,6-glucosidase/alpha-glucosidase